MAVEALIGLGDKPSVKPLLLDTGFVSGHQEDRLPIGIKRKENTPSPAMRFTTQFLHVRVLRSLQRIRMWPTESWAFQFQQTRLHQDRVLDGRREQIELSLEIVKKCDDPAHGSI